MTTENTLSLQLKNGISLNAATTTIGKKNEAIIFDGVAKGMIVPAPFYIVQNEEKSFNLVINKDAFAALNGKLILKNFSAYEDENKGEEIVLPSFLDIAKTYNIDASFHEKIITSGVEPGDWRN